MIYTANKAKHKQANSSAFVPFLLVRPVNVNAMLQLAGITGKMGLFLFICKNNLHENHPCTN
jgi:hypothetical protein